MYTQRPDSENNCLLYSSTIVKIEASKSIVTALITNRLLIDNSADPIFVGSAFLIVVVLPLLGIAEARGSLMRLVIKLKIIQ